MASQYIPTQDGQASLLEVVPSCREVANLAITEDWSKAGISNVNQLGLTALVQGGAAGEIGGGVRATRADACRSTMTKLGCPVPS
eukprot:5254462-Amphidinium_carterae.1